MAALTAPPFDTLEVVELHGHLHPAPEPGLFDRRVPVVGCVLKDRFVAGDQPAAAYDYAFARLERTGVRAAPENRRARAPRGRRSPAAGCAPDRHRRRARSRRSPQSARRIPPTARPESERRRSACDDRGAPLASIGSGIAATTRLCSSAELDRAQRRRPAPRPAAGPQGHARLRSSQGRYRHLLQ